MAMAAAVTAEAVWHALHDRLLRFIRARVEDDASAEDILQEVFLKIHARIDSLRDEERLEGWVWQIARNAIADHHRGRRRTVALPEALPAPEAGEAETEEAARWLLPAVRATIDALPEPYREALLATESEGFTQQELADRAGISLSGAKSRVQRARAKLKEVLLACCHLEFDRRGGLILDQAQPLCACCAGGSCAADCCPAASAA
ncbi:MAG: RNA polymerase sigma factor SigZ [Chloroflexota bacterium]|nr:RNA polymerase sigma factor SigZ [Chloroflexota bacterium]